MKLLRLALLSLRREWKSGELALLGMALVVAVAAISAVGFFADRVRQALEREAHQLLGADLLLVADHPWPESLADEARQRGLAVAETRSFPSMVFTSARAQLTDIKAVSAGYPLRGTLRTTLAPGAPDAPARGGPQPGTAWVDERLAAALAVLPGDTVRLGDSTLIVAAIVTLEPDRGIDFFALAPRLFVHIDELPGTGLIQPGSRVTYRLLLAGDAPAVAAFRSRVTPGIGRGERLEDATSARPEMRVALERAQRFLGLAALLTVVLAAVAVALAARRTLQRHLDPCAIMRCLGASESDILAIYGIQFLLLGLIAGALGAALGYGGHFLLHAWLNEIVATQLPAPSWLPAGQGIAVGLLLLLGFALPPLLQLKRVPTLRVLRRELGPPAGGLLGGFATGLAALAGLMLWIAADVRLGLWVIGGFVAALVLFALVARLFIRLAARLRAGAHAAGGFGWRHGLANLERHPLSAVLQVVALALGMMALLLLTTTRGELLDAWRRAAPADAPNRFIVNIQPGQLADIRRLFAEAGVAADFPPMIRGRLTTINGRAVAVSDYDDDRAQRLIEREFNLSWAAEAPAGNRIVAGRWFSAPGQPEASVEEGLAKTLGIAVGDTLLFTVAGETVSVRVVGLRKLDWDSMRVNFFVLTPPGILDGYPASHITSFHLPADKAGLVQTLLAAHPNLTIVDVGAILRQVQGVLDQVARAVQFVFLFTLLAGLIVLFSALLSAFDERRYELALLRALGASRGQLRRTLLAEFAAVGGLAGLIAGIGAQVVGQLLARQVLQLELAPNPWLPLLAVLGGAVLVAAAGWGLAGRLINASPLPVLRAE